MKYPPNFWERNKDTLYARLIYSAFIIGGVALIMYLSPILR